MYHHVNKGKDNFTISPDDFQVQMEYLARKNYQTLFLDELDGAFTKGKKPQAVITFDDGYLDNWVYAYPILKKYNLKATIFVVTSRIKEGTLRPNLGDVWGDRVKENQLPKISTHYESNLRCVGNLEGSADHINWEEARAMSQSGLVDIQSHSHLHDYCYVSDEITGYYRGTKWRTGWLTGGDLRLGIPLYEDKPALAGRKYFDDKSLRDSVAGYVASRGGEGFFTREDWKSELDRLVSDYRKKGKLQDSYETLQEREKRTKDELLLAKNIIEKKLNKECKFIAWPGGAYDNDLVEWAKECGYRAAVTTQPGTNSIHTDPMYLKRFEVKKGKLGWFKNRLFIYSHNWTAAAYTRLRAI
jgi:peptidoglycan/xylan/chitin deacetylase (PgdA/CDA1 family)